MRRTHTITGYGISVTEPGEEPYLASLDDSDSLSVYDDKKQASSEARRLRKTFKDHVFRVVPVIQFSTWEP